MNNQYGDTTKEWCSDDWKAGVVELALQVINTEELSDE